MMRRAIALAVLGALVMPAAAYADEEFTSGPVTYLIEEKSVAVESDGSDFVICPPTRSVSGGGVAIIGTADSSDDLDVASLYPGDFLDPDPTPDDLWNAWVRNDDTSAHDMRTTAICVKPSKASLTYASTPGMIGAGGFTSTHSAACSGGGTVTSGGFDSGAASADLVELEELGHSFNGKDANYSGVASAFGKEGAGFSYTTFAACTTASLKHRYVDKVLFGGINTLKVKCPRGTRVLGGGFSRFPTDLLASEPFDAKDADNAPDDGWKFKARYGSPSAGFAYAHCLA